VEEPQDTCPDLPRRLFVIIRETGVGKKVTCIPVRINLGANSQRFGFCTPCRNSRSARKAIPLSYVNLNGKTRPNVSRRAGQAVEQNTSCSCWPSRPKGGYNPSAHGDARQCRVIRQRRQAFMCPGADAVPTDPLDNCKPVIQRGSDKAGEHVGCHHSVSRGPEQVGSPEFHISEAQD